MGSSLLLLTEGGGGVHDQAYVRIADLEITIYMKNFEGYFFVKTILFMMKLCLKTRNFEISRKISI